MISPEHFDRFGDKAIMALHLYVSENQKTFKLLEDAVESNNIEDVKFCAHKMCGSAKMITALNVADVAEKIEVDIINSGDYDENDINQLREEFELICTHIGDNYPS